MSRRVEGPFAGSRSGIVRRAGAARAAALSLACGLLAAPAAGAGWEFHPALSLSGSRTDNAALVESAPGSPGREAATMVVADVTLPLSFQGDRDELTLSYRPIRETYTGLDTIDASALDNTAHYAALSWSRKRSERTQWDLRGGWSRADRARLAFDAPEQDLVALPRTRIESFAGRVAFTTRPGRRIAIDGAVTFNDVSYGQQEVAAPGAASSLPLDGSRTLGLEGSVERELSRSQRIGVGYRGSRIDEGRRGEVDVHRIVLGWRYGRSERFEWTLSLGASRTDVRVAAPDDPPGLDGETGVVGTLALRSRLGRKGELTAGVGRDVGATGGTSGPAESTSGHASISLPTGQWSSVSFAGRWSDRTPLGQDPDLSPPTRTTALRAEWRAALSEPVSIVVSGERVDQRSEAASAPLQVDYTIWSLGLRWEPGKGRR